MAKQKEQSDWEWIEVRILAEKNKHENMGNNEWAKIAAIKINSEISTQIQQSYKDGYNACLKDFKIKNDCGEKSL